ncbi:putative glycosidase [Escovopsis weberi]|uniref:Putative glycosidase n=1 Tax=Escovopsis weberi TaxID=150374 RepID=A0A0M9VSC9_ESCWE|nr:putative glycosidase [Escovopsis weberi]
MAYPYSLATSYMGETLLSGFNWFDGSDPNHGFVSYSCREVAKSMGLYSIDEYSGVVRLGVDSTNSYALNQGRPSIRLESKQSYNEGLFIADFLHMPPSKCGLWPAFWAYGNDWPNNGEIDIIEGANLNTRNLMSAHTRAGCSQPPLHATRSLARFTGQQRTAECSVGSDNTGCGYEPPAGDATSYGDGFNAVGGGVYAMQWDAESIKLWHFERGMIPSDVVEKRPDPEGWGLPQAVFGGEACDTRSYWRNMNIVLNINFCGDFGGGIWGNSECRNLASTCAEANHTRVLDTRPVTGTIPGFLGTAATRLSASMTTIFTGSASSSCFKSDESFPGFVLFQNATDMTASECAAICMDANTSYAGLFKTDCYCSHYFDDPLMTSIKDDECNHECPGDATQRCGGALQDGLRALSIFDIKEDDPFENVDNIEMPEGADPDVDYTSSYRAPTSSGAYASGSTGTDDDCVCTRFA